MHLIRRSAFRAVSSSSSSSSSIISKPRSITTSTPFILRSKTQASVSSSVFSRRFNSDDAQSSEKKNGVESADGEQSAVRSAIESASESASTYASDAAERVGRTAEYASDAVADAASGAAAAFGGRGGESSGYGMDRRGGRGGFGRRDEGRGFGGGDRYGGAPSRGGYGDRRAPFGGFEAPTVPSTAVYVGNLLFDVTAKDLQNEFGSFGPIQSAIIAADSRGLSKGFGYVEFETVEQAAAAIEAKHQSVMEGRRIVVNYMIKNTRAQSRENEPSKTLFIGNLAFEMSDADLNKLFRDIRNVIDVRVAIDRRTGQPRGFAHADFVDVESAVKGKEALFGKEIYGRKLRVDFSAGRDAREGGAPRDQPRY